MDFTDILSGLAAIVTLWVIGSWVFKMNTIVKHLEDIKALLESQVSKEQEASKEDSSNS